MQSGIAAANQRWEVLHSYQQLPSTIRLNADGTYEVSDLAIWQFLKDTAGGKHSPECQSYMRTALNALLHTDVLDICMTIMQEQLLSWSPHAIERPGPPFDEREIIHHLWMCGMTKQSYTDMFCCKGSSEL